MLPARRSLVHVLALVLIGSLLLNSPVTLLARGNRYFPETGFIVDEPILSIFERFGDVPVIGLPISDAMVTICEQHTCTVQWFERTRIEIHHDMGQAYRGRIGADFLAQRGTPWQFGHDDPLHHAAEAPCIGFPETGHVTCASFLTAWQRYGGVERLGLPITGVQEETYVDGGSGQTVTFHSQWFERAALEDHGTQGVLLRLLGSQTYPTWAERLMADLINAERAKAGLPVLAWHDGLAQIAQGHSLDSAQHNLQSHTGSDGRNPGDRTAALGLPGAITGEVISFQQSPVRAVESLLQSPDHRPILLDSKPTHLGVGYGVVLGQVRGGRWPATVWTVDFWVMS